MNHRAIRVALAGTAALALVPLSACSAPAESASSGGSPVTVDELAGREMVATSADGRDLVHGSEITLSVQSGQLSSNAGCNMINGPIEISEGVLTLTSHAAMTMMMCDDELMDQETWFSDFLESGPRISADGDAVRLSDGEVSLVFHDRD